MAASLDRIIKSWWNASEAGLHFPLEAVLLGAPVLICDRLINISFCLSVFRENSIPSHGSGWEYKIGPVCVCLCVRLPALSRLNRHIHRTNFKPLTQEGIKVGALTSTSSCMFIHFHCFQQFKERAFISLVSQDSLKKQKLYFLWNWSTSDLGTLKQKLFTSWFLRERCNVKGKIISCFDDSFGLQNVPLVVLVWASYLTNLGSCYHS